MIKRESRAYAVILKKLQLIIFAETFSWQGFPNFRAGTNYRYQRSGTLWEGRYKACLVQSEQYLLEIYRYIELNPVRAARVNEPGDYNWLRYAINALGVESDLQTPHPEYLALGKTNAEGLSNYRGLFKAPMEQGCWKKSEYPLIKDWLLEMNVLLHKSKL